MLVMQALEPWPWSLESLRSTCEHLVRAILLRPHTVEVSAWRRNTSSVMSYLQIMICPLLNDGHVQFGESVNSAPELDDWQMDATGGEIKAARYTASRMGDRHP